MRMVAIENVEEGLILARPIYDENARILLNVGTALTSSHINRLKKRITFIYVKSDITDDIEMVEDNIPFELRLKTTSTLSSIFSSLTNKGSQKNNLSSRINGINQLKSVLDQVLIELHHSSNLINLLSHLQVKNDNTMFEHSLNTSLYSISIGKALGIDEKSLHILGIGALFHDIGKLQLPKELLEKENKSEEEKELIQLHTEFGFEMLRRETELHLLVAHCAYQHHENMNGSGYPRGLKGDEIHLFARIISVAEKFDYLINRKALLPHEAMEILYGYCYSRYDINVIEAFKKAVTIYPIGITVTLNTGEKGIIVGNDPKYPQRPKVRVYQDKDGRRLSIQEFYDIDLMHVLSIMIIKCDAIIERKASVS